MEVIGNETVHLRHNNESVMQFSQQVDNIILTLYDWIRLFQCSHIASFRNTLGVSGIHLSLGTLDSRFRGNDISV